MEKNIVDESISKIEAVINEAYEACGKAGKSFEFSDAIKYLGLWIDENF